MTTLGTGLARAFLAGEWVPEAMARRGRRAIDEPGRRGRWMLDLARAARAGFPEAPRDAPRELAAFLDACPVLTKVLAGRPRPSVRHWYTSPTAMAARAPGWPAPALDTLKDLQDLLGLDAGLLAWFADAKSLERHAADQPLRHYRYRWSPKRAGGYRLIEEPKPMLARIQRTLLRHILDAVPPHPAAHGFRKHHSALTHAAQHAGRPAVVRFDLEAFFASVPAGRIYGIIRTAGYPEPVASALTGLTTNVVPRAVWRAGPTTDHLLGRRLATPHLPQGAPTSPTLANLAAFGLDRRLAGLAGAMGARYSRYADDLTFSGGHHLWRKAPDLTRLVGAIAAEEGFRLNHAKTSRRAAGERQLVTGLVVNARPNVRRTDYDALKATVHNALRTGGPAQNRHGRPDFRAHLDGRIAWLEHVHPVHGAKVRREFEQVVW